MGAGLARVEGGAPRALVGRSDSDRKAMVWLGGRAQTQRLWRTALCELREPGARGTSNGAGVETGGGGVVMGAGF